jgi:hypothetical protein
MTQTSKQKEELEKAQASAPSKDELRDIASRVPPLQRTDETSFVSVEDTDLETDPEAIQPNLTGTGTAGLAAAEETTLKVTRPDPAKSTYERSTALGEVELERMTDEQIKSAGVLKKATPQINPARLAGTSDRPRQPTARVPAAGAGSWPLNESQMPAVMPTDPPVEDRAELDNGFAKAAGFSSNKDGTLAKKGLRIRKNEVSAAAALYASLRQRFPQFTKEQLADEFETQWLSMRIGGEQSHRAGPELSSQGLTAVGDHRVETVGLGELRAKSDAAFEADPAKSSPSNAPAAGLPSENEPASKAVDDAKEPSGETAAADKAALAAAAKFDHDGDGKPGGAPPGGNKPKQG